MTRYSANWRAKASNRNSGTSHFRFQAASDADAAAIAAAAGSGLSAQLTSLNKYVFDGDLYGVNHPEGTARTDNFSMITAAGESMAFDIRNIRAGVTHESIVTALATNTTAPSGVRVLGRGETEVEPLT
jgi:hypothetical protein